MKKPEIFYGWWIVAAIFLISAYAYGIIFYGFTALLEPIINEFGWSYTQVSFAASLRGMETGLLTPVVGFLIDRFGARRLIFTGVIIVGLGLLLFSRITSLWMFYAVFFIISIGTSTCSGAVTLTVVGKWFQKNVSTANGIATCGSSFGGLLVPLVARSIEIFDWRTTLIILAAGMFIIALPLTFVIRNKPEQYGDPPGIDTKSRTAKGNSRAIPVTRSPSSGVRQALKTRSFWQFSLGLTCHVIATTSIITHVMPYLSSIGIAKTTSSMVASGIALFGIVGRFIFGWFGDRFDKRVVLASALAMTIAGLVLFCYVADVGTWLVLPFVILFGIGFGGPVPMIATIIIGYFGRDRLGSILGLSMGIMMLGGMIGPPLAGWVFDSFHSYVAAWFAFAAITAAGMILVFTLPSGKTLEKP